MKVYFDAGSGDVAGTFHHWELRRADPNQIAVTYSSLFFDVCRALDIQAFVRSTNARVERIERDWITIEQSPTPRFNIPKVGYDAELLVQCLRVVRDVLQSRSDVAMLGTHHMSMVYSVLPPLGVKVFTSIHNTLDQDFVGMPSHRVHQLLLKLTGRAFLGKSTSAIMAVSPMVLRQALSYAGNSTTPGIVFRPVYSRETFARIPPADHSAKPFRVLYAGRVEVSKGVIDLVRAAKLLADQPGPQFFFHIAGIGNGLEQMREEVKALGLEASFAFHGFCEHDRLSELFASCHAVIVPTRSAFNEGLNKVVVEAVLSGRPAVVSEACPAHEYFPGAVIVVPPNQPELYAEKLRELAIDPQAYERARAACGPLAAHFYDSSNTYYAVMKAILQAMKDGASVQAALDQLRPRSVPQAERREDLDAARP